MASLVKLARVVCRHNLVKISRNAIAVVPSRCAGHWNKDWKPGPYPVTPEDYAVAAKKYGMRVEDYEPIPDDGHGHGDYPNLPVYPEEFRSGYEDYDIPQIKRNYGDPMHVDSDSTHEAYWNPEYMSRYPYSLTFMASVFVGIVAVVGGLNWLVDDYRIHPVAELVKEWPQDGKRHYVFEPAD